MRDSSDRGLKQAIDWKIIIYYLLLVFIGFINIYASIHSSEPSSIFDFSVRSGKQFVWILTGIVLAVLILFVFNPRLWEVISIPSYLVVLVLLVAVIFVGSDVKGSHSWFNLGPVSFQPAEVSKIATSLVLATIMSKTNFKMSNLKDLLLVAAVIALPMLIIVAEKETGSALVYLGFIFVLYREGLSGWFLFFLGVVILLFILTLTTSIYTALIVLAAVASLCYSLYSGKIKRWFWADIPAILVLIFLPKFNLPFNPLYVYFALTGVQAARMAYNSFRQRKFITFATLVAFLVGIGIVFSTEYIFNNVLQDHQRSRIEVLLGMKDDPAGVGYNVNQSKIAIGSGGLFGKGFLQGTQTTYGFVPEQSTDFIFCTVGEEWGFVGCLIVILLYVLLIYRLIVDAERCRDQFTRIYGYCVAAIIFMHLFINVGMTIGIMPVIGIPLPLLSYGGSSLWSFTVLIFIFVALYRQEKKYF